MESDYQVIEQSTYFGCIVNTEDKSKTPVGVGCELELGSYTSCENFGYNNKISGTNSITFGRDNEVKGNNNIVLGHGIKISGDDKIIIGKIDLLNLLNRLEELEKRVEYLWWMPGGPECKKAEEHFIGLVAGTISSD